MSKTDFCRIVNFDFHFSYRGIDGTTSLEGVEIDVGWDKRTETEQTDEESAELYNKFMDFLEEHLGNFMDDYHMKCTRTLHDAPRIEREEYLSGCVKVVEEETV